MDNDELDGCLVPCEECPEYMDTCDGDETEDEDADRPLLL